MWKMASRLLFTTGAGQSNSAPLTAFDRALQNAGVGDYNHCRLSSIIPPGADLINADIGKYRKDLQLYLPSKGVFLPSVWSECQGIQGDKIIASIGIGINADTTLPGMLFELHQINTELNKTISMVKKMVITGFQDRGWELKTVQVVYKQLQVSMAYGCVNANAIYLE